MSSWKQVRSQEKREKRWWRERGGLIKENRGRRLSGAVERNRALQEEPVRGHLLYISCVLHLPPPTLCTPPCASHLGLIVLFHSFSPPTPLSNRCFCFFLSVLLVYFQFYTWSLDHLTSFVIHHFENHETQSPVSLSLSDLLLIESVQPPLTCCVWMHEYAHSFICVQGHLPFHLNYSTPWKKTGTNFVFCCLGYLCVITRRPH